MPIDSKMSQMLLEIFQAELKELHQSMIEALLCLEKLTKEDALEKNLSELFRYSHNMKGAATSAGIKPLADMAHQMEDLFTDWRQKKHFPKKKQISACLKVVDSLLDVMELHCKGEVIDIEDYVAPLYNHDAIIKKEPSRLIQHDLIKLSLSRIEQASAKANDFLNYQLKLENWFKEINHSLKELNEVHSDKNNTSFIKKMTTIASEGGQFLGDFSRSVHSLQEEFKTMRMLPIATVLQPLDRTVRDVAFALNKTVELKIEGGDIELDKNILDAIRDPLQHLVRNAIDHGIETDEERKKMNKPVPATLRIGISQTSGKIKLELSDDGHGIDLKKIKKQALSMGLFSKDDLDGFNEQQLLNCIFTSGFSTQKQVTEISGRGVGLDVVKNHIEAIQGTISVETIEGKGTCFVCYLPLTLSTTRGLFFQVNNQLFMLPTISLHVIYQLNWQNLKRVDNQSILIVDNKPVPIKMMSQILQMTPTPLDKDKTYYGLSIENASKHFVLLIDHIVDERQCVVKALPPPYAQIEQYIGVTLHGENELVLVLDPSKLSQMAMADDSSWLDHLHMTSIDKKTSIKKRVLIADDSLTSRILCANAVEMAGYEAVSTNDGNQAWLLLQKEPFDCVITDILMPEMDGFAFTKLIKSNEQYAHIPVIVVSSLDSKKDKQKGLEAGANAFIVKSEFDTKELIEIMESII